MYSTLRDLLVADKQMQNTAPDCFLCPITTDIMREPMVASDGFSYERDAIEAWLARSDRSPMTNDVLTSRALIPNAALRSAIFEFLNKS
jgi:hypothetical protein